MTRIIRKPWILTFALTLLLVTPFAAAHGQSQDQNPQDQNEQSKSVSHDATTLEGTVKEVSDDKIVIETSSGVHEIELASTTELPSDVAMGDKVTIQLDQNQQDLKVATAVTQTERTQAERDQFQADRTESDRYEDRGTRQDATRADQRGALPQTASGLPLAGLVGLLSLIGAVAFRSFRS